MFEQTTKVLCLIIICFGRQGFSSVHLFDPPTLSLPNSFIDLQRSGTLDISCTGKHPVSWKLPFVDNENDTRTNILFYVNITDPLNKYGATLVLEDLDYRDTGYYTCYYNGTTDFSTPVNFSSIYVFINDPNHLFLENPASIMGHLLIPLQQHRKGVIPCLPTHSHTNVTLWKTESEDDYGEMVYLGMDVTFDPRVGFVLYYPSIYFNGFFQCRAYSERLLQVINLTLIFMVDTYNDPQPFINASGAQHPVINGTFTLKCTVDVDPDTRLFIDWSYPNKNKSQNRINETQPFSQWKTTRRYRHQEVTTSLVVWHAQASDSGTYVCTVTDHSQKTGRASANIFVYDSQQPIHVNFTTDLDTSQPIVGEAGQDVRFVITVHAFPSVKNVELFWEKNGKKLLRTDNHYRIINTNSSVVLEIKQITRSDAATYVLHGKTKDTNSSITILLEVKDVPSVSVRNAAMIYHVGQEHILECHADGYPVPIVWWRWKPCPLDSMAECVPGGPFGWKDVEPIGNFPNQENVSLEFSYEKGFSLVSYVHLVAKQSGHYKCIASNVMGKDEQIIPLVVTDAANGFELSISKKKPVDKDVVMLTCKADTYNFNYLQWKFRPMDSTLELSSLKNSPDVTISNETSAYSHKSVITFTPIRMNLSGEYECTAVSWRNDATKTSHLIIDVKAIRKPVLNSTNMLGFPVITELGSQQEFHCYVYGVPFPEVTWKKDGRELDVTNMSGVEMSERNQRLAIRRVLERDAGFYECLAFNKGGVVKANASLIITLDDKDRILTKGEITALTAACLVVLILFLLIAYILKRIRKDKKQKKELDFISHNLFERGYIDIFNPNLPLEDQIDLLPYKHHCEFPKERLKLGKTLGQGAFGRVVKAEAVGLVDGEASTTVAVKMLKEAANQEQRKALIAELKILIHIGKHLNIVNLLGAVTKNISKGELYVIVEYCSFGNLRHFLLKRKSFFIDQLDHRTGHLDPHISTLPGSPFSNLHENIINPIDGHGMGLDNPTYRTQSLNYADLSHQQMTTDSGTGVSVFSNPSGSSMGDRYLSNSRQDDENLFITTCDLLCFCFQCARGMEYLASRKLIHRDLAARNVLLAQDNVVKICDFGLAKDCYKYSNYVKKSDGLLPIKWMAIESILDRVFTTKSDIWSFGILLWEIFTLGGNPYPGAEINEEFFKKLKNGYRMGKPELAPNQIYNLMKNCWLDDPNQRPDFCQLAENIGNLLERSVRKYYVDLNTPYQMLNKELFSNNNDYLQMVGVTQEPYTHMMDPLNTYQNVVGPTGNESLPMLQLKDTNKTDSEIDDSVFLASEVFYENDLGLYRHGEEQMSTRC